MLEKSTTVAPHVLITGEDAASRDVLTTYLTQNDIRVSAAASGIDLFKLLFQETIDLVLLDGKLPGNDGLQLMRSLRERASVPIIVLSECLDEADRVMGLELGADDYLTKPYSLRELLARIHAVLRRYQLQTTVPQLDHTQRAYRFAGWELNLRTRRLMSADGTATWLSNAEFSLLSALCRAPQRVLTRGQLLSMSRLHEEEVYDRSIDVQIRRLRLKLETDPASPTLLLTERGVGYRLNSSVGVLYG